MKRGNYFLCLSIFLWFQARNAFAQVVSSGPPTLNGALANATIGLNPKTGIFLYEYTVENSTASTGSITSFQIDITTTSGIQPAGTDLQNSASGYLSIISASVETTLGPSIIPIGIVTSPVRWHSGINSNGTVGWAQIPGAGSKKIIPGKSQGGYGLTSYGPPGIRKFTVGASFDPTLYFAGIDSLSEEQAEQEMAALRAANAAASAIGFTVGPVSSPTSSDAGQLIAALIVLKHQAVAQGWLCGSRFIDDLDNTLDRANDAYTKKHLQETSDELENFIAQLSQQRQAQPPEFWKWAGDLHHDDRARVTNNAYYLLATNTEYILSKIHSKDDGYLDQDNRKDHH